MSSSVVFNRIDYAQVGATSNGCLRIIHVDNPGEEVAREKIKLSRKGSKGSGGNCDKIVIGAQNGVVLCIERKNADTNIVFKTPPGPGVNSVRLGGALQTNQDKTFIATKTEVKGFTRKGKQFLAFESNMTEGISSMYIYGVDMFLCGRNSLYHFHDCVEKNAFVCSEPITDVICLPVIEGGWVGRGLTPVLGCVDKTIKVIEGSRLAYQVRLNEVPNVLHLYMNDGGYNKQKVLFGTRNGLLGLVNLDVERGEVLWEMETRSFAAITAIHCFAIIENTRMDVVFGKEDGLLEIYSEAEDSLTFRQQYQCEESITGIECGRVSSPNFAEIVVSTYTGWVFALTTEPLFPEEPSSIIESRTPAPPQLEIKVQQLKIELEQLETKVLEERTRFQEAAKTGHEAFLKTKSQLSGSTEDANAGFVAIPHFTINDRFVLRKELACYTLSIELAVPIDYVLLQSDVKVDLMDVERNSAVVSMTPPEVGSGNALLAVYRCQADVTRMEMRIRSIEGQFGTLRLYVVPRSLPLVCRVRTYPIKPLALHERVHDFDGTRPLNTLTFTGQFSMAEAHSWLVQCVSQLPERCPQQDTVTFNFKSTFNGGTVLQATYSKGKAIYRSDNLSTIVILRDVISKITAMHQLKVHISCDIDDKSIEHTLKLIHPKMEYQSNLVKRLELAKGLKELEASFEDTSYLNKELRVILGEHDSLHDEAIEQSAHFDRTLGIITDLYIDKYKMMGQDVKHKANDLLLLLQDEYTLENLINFFNTNK